MTSVRRIFISRVSHITSPVLSKSGRVSSQNDSVVMATEYERLRESNIAKNKVLLDGLSLVKSTLHKNAASELPRKRRKLAQTTKVPEPTRFSARLSAQPLLSYAEEANKEPPVMAVPRPLPETVLDLDSESFQNTQERWKWQPSAKLPYRDAKQTLHFPDYPDVVSFDSV